MNETGETVLMPQEHVTVARVAERCLLNEENYARSLER
jgi:hypothetical protein